MSHEADERLFSTLRADPGFRQLVQAVALGEGFQFLLVISDSLRVLRAALQCLETDAPLVSGTAVSVVFLDPAAAKNGDSSGVLTETQLLDRILAPLVQPPFHFQSESCILVINGATATVADEPAWRALFHRMNERRNTIARRIHSTVLLCLTPSLYATFARAAPDFWSIRSGVITFATPVLVPGFTEQRTNNELLDVGRDTTTPWMLASADTLAEAVTQARKRLDALPDDVSAARALLIQLGRWGDSCWMRGDSTGASAAHREAFAIAERLSQADRDNSQWQRDLSVSYAGIGDMLARENQRAEALRYLEQARAISARLAEHDPSNATWKNDLAWVQQRIAGLQ